jgi:replicative DNA helicase
MLASEILRTVMSKLERQNEISSHALSTGIDSLDRLIGGWESGVILIAARPHMGKTLLCLNFAYHLIETLKNDEKIVYVTNQVSKEALMQRLLAIGTKLSLTKIQTGTLPAISIQHLNEHPFVVKLMEDNLLIFDHNAPTICDIRSIFLHLKHEGKPPKTLIIDTLPFLMVGQDRDKKGLLESMMSELSLLSQELEIPIIVTTPLSRSVEYRDSHIPRLTDIDQKLLVHVSKVLLLVRPAYYDVVEIKADSNEEAHLIVAKNNGALDTIQLNINMATHKITQDSGLLYSLNDFE